MVTLKMKNKIDLKLCEGGRVFECPVCGEKHKESLKEGLVVSLSEYAGTYCLRCWAKWISENIPKCVEVDSE